MKKGLKTVITGAVLFVLAVFVLPLALLVPVVLQDSSPSQFLIPGVAEFELEAPGRYYLWNDYRTIFEGESFHRSESLPDGLRMVVRGAAGDELKLITDASISLSSGSRSQRSIGYVDVPQAGSWEVEVSGEVKSRVFSFGESKVLKLFGLIFGAAVCCVILAVAGLIVGVIGVVQLADNAP